MSLSAGIAVCIVLYCISCYMVYKVVAYLVLFQLGDDSFGQDFLGSLKNNKINTDHVHITKDVSSGMAQITVAENGKRQLVYV